jgi:hypothetical protein
MRVRARQIASPEELRHLDLEARFGIYQARDAQWVPGQPLVVNRDFDFETAMTLDGAGSGLAVAKRRDGNAALAKQLAGLPPIRPEALLRNLVDPCGDRCPLMAHGIERIYGVLYGDREARLRIVVEPAQPDEQPLLYVAVSASRDAATFADPGVLASAFHAGLATLASKLFLPRPPTEHADDDARCVVGDATYVLGQTVVAYGDIVIMTAATPCDVTLLCPRDAYTQGLR